MESPLIYRILMGLAFVSLLGIRVHYQKKVLAEDRSLELHENPLGLAAGAVAALTSLLFGAEFIFFPGTFGFAYPINYPAWLRWLGAFTLCGGIFLLGSAHAHLGASFHSFVGTKADHQLVTSGPYRWIRHPIYSAYLLSYVGGGLLASNLVLTIGPLAFFSLMIIDRIPREEAVLRRKFGEDYLAWEERTGKLLPRIPGQKVQ